MLLIDGGMAHHAEDPDLSESPLLTADAGRIIETGREERTPFEAIARVCGLEKKR